MNRLKPLFPQIADAQWNLLEEMAALHREWNAKVNLVSRKDMQNLECHHYAPCIAATHFLKLMDGARIIDIGTGGGFPGLILAALYPRAHFTLIDSVEKKVNAVRNIALRMKLRNVETLNLRVETLKCTYDFATGRAVTSLAQFIQWARPRLRRGAKHSLENGVLYWKGGKLDADTESVGIEPTTVFSLEKTLDDPHFSEKYILHYRTQELSRSKLPESTP
ncbi:MAG: 16S rRNA (guanine(527)-N(7))-methyltransferase RsmG [Puniceicoccales bacterium]|nr:16S rRNA (guanine(527)-N(7))-methyltransferase RsmG [Puniceicoccales bacterium]